MTIKPRQMICPQSNWANKCPYTMVPQYITVHNTANDASANNEISYMNRNNNQCSFHFAIDDKEVVQGIPLNRNAWHAGDGANGTGNRKTIGIEICYSKSGGNRFIEAEKLAAKFIAQLLKERNWGIDRVKKHQDWSGKYCPHRTLDMGWPRFLNMIKKELDPKPAKVINWVDVPKTTMYIKKETNLINLDTGVSIKNLSGEFTFIQKTDDNKYVRTEYSKKKNLNYGVLFDSLEVIPVPEPEEPTIPEEKPEPDQTITILQSIISFIQSIIDKLLKK